MKPKGLSELWAATSDLANQTGIEKKKKKKKKKKNNNKKKNRSFDHPQAELDILSFQKHINGPWKPEARNRTSPSFYASNFDDDSIRNE